MKLKGGRFSRNLFFVGILALALGGFIFIINYERQTIQITESRVEYEILEYRAPGWDPFPHTAKIVIDTEAPVRIQASIQGEMDSEETFIIQSGEELVRVFPKETLTIVLYNTQPTTGTVKTVLWCDSWNYAAGLWVAVGVVILIGSLILRGSSR